MKLTVYSFVMKCLEIRQKILLFSGKPDDLSYTPQFINKFFLRTLERGVRSPFIFPGIKHLLKADNVCDEDLLAAVMRASTYEHERSTLQSRASKKIVKVHEVSSKANSKAKQDDSVSKLVTAIESLSSQLASLKQDFQDLKQKNLNSRNRSFVRQTYTTCDFCTLNNVDKCTHCYLCGTESHRTRRCPSKVNQGNC